MNVSNERPRDTTGIFTPLLEKTFLLTYRNVPPRPAALQTEFKLRLGGIKLAGCAVITGM